MFESLSERLSGILDKLTGRGALSEADVNEAMREVRRALIEADVALPVVRSFTDKVRNRAVGAEVVKSVTPGQMVIKIVHDQLVDMLGAEAEPIDLNAPAPVAIMMVGLQGSGKTTTTAKIARRLTNRDKRKVLMASLDTRRPAAQEQLKVLGEQNGVDTLPIVAGQGPVEIAKRAIQAARLGGYDVVLLDTAGRIHIDEALMLEMAEVKAATNPHEILLVADSLTGQDAVNLAKSFDERVGITGIALTRMDGDGRGGAALSMRAVTGKPVKLIGVGEKADALEDFHPRRIADRILGMGDIVSLVEKAAEAIDAEKAAKMAAKLQKGTFDLEDLAEQLKQMEKLGGMSGMMSMLPGIGKMKKQMEAANIDERMFKRQVAIIQSMTPTERRKPDLLKASRKKRIAAGSGVDVAEVNKLLKMHRQMADVMKMMGKNKGMLGKMMGMLGGGMAGGMPSIDPKQLEQLAKSGQVPGAGDLLKGLTDAGATGAPGAAKGLPGGVPGLPGLGGPKLPGLGGFPGFPGFGKGKK
ncbi:signal recognition particle protein [Microvirga tunisiensis]|uniref:Signal recognition particle protein n=2 Tax=Pannonibacter tanglangensis TaxID=2750084 RepID=A0ABW9ZL20_9HYPH|nr:MULTISPECIES: signal recognition particle protein [unclassified Pannonibacter]NBN65570.1 signal recognition particle protein [Pannonibacter sp. XCT-34]NBN80203.1 signal recognition particle protein [Pannonibacter sp. XCT-53]